jgi:hypothetical protein
MIEPRLTHISMRTHLNRQTLGMPKNDLIEGQKKRRVLSTSTPIGVSIKLADAEQTLDMRRRAARLFCRAMIRIYLRDNGSPNSGKSMGVL